MVPLKFNKLDLRDYLWHVYDVRVRGVRSQVKQQAPRRLVEEAAGAPARGRWYRPQHKKVYAALQKAYAGDAHVSTVEIYLLSELRLRFRV